MATVGDHAGVVAGGLRFPWRRGGELRLQGRDPCLKVPEPVVNAGQWSLISQSYLSAARTRARKAGSVATFTMNC